MDRKCVRFTCGGCDAKGNNFEEKAECERSCSGVTGETQDTEDRWTHRTDGHIGKLRSASSGRCAVQLRTVVSPVEQSVYFRGLFERFKKEEGSESGEEFEPAAAHGLCQLMDSLLPLQVTSPWRFCWL